MNSKDKITAKIIADSISPQGVRMTTMEIEYPRFILAELNTHRMLSKNSASSRAIPVKAMHEFIDNSPAEPVYWGKNQAGMQAKAEIGAHEREEAKYIWIKAKEDALHWSGALAERLEVHKQIANRITEPWMTMKTVISGTEWRNFWWLRCHADAQPEIRVLAQKMFELYQQHQPQQLQPGEWHVPYVLTRRDDRDNLQYLDSNDVSISATEARIVSASCCAQVSYRKNDDTLEKATKIYRQLIESEPAHASPVEHQATPMRPGVDNYAPEAWQPGTTHVSARGDLWSGNLRGWIQHRKLITGEAKW